MEMSPVFLTVSQMLNYYTNGRAISQSLSMRPVINLFLTICSIVYIVDKFLTTLNWWYWLWWYYTYFCRN